MADSFALPDIDAYVMSGEELADYQRAKARRLEKRVQFLAAENARLHRLLAATLLVAAGRECDPLALLEVIAASTGDDLARAATSA